jgi:hypothetical protein
VSTSTTTRLTLPRPHLSLRDRAFTLATFAAAVAIFLTLGWSLMEPVDPQGAVSALARGGGLGLIIKAAALAAATAALATAVGGVRLADIGTFATGLGLMLVSIRGHNAAALLTEQAAEGGTMRGLAAWMAVESLGWCGVMAVAMVVSGFVMKSLFVAPPVEPDPSDDGATLDAKDERTRTAAAWALAAFDVPRLAPRWFTIGDAPLTPWRDGVRHAVIATGVAFVLVMILSAGVASRAIRHGEACFLVAAALFAGSWAAHWLAPARSALWSMAAVPLLTTFGYIYAAVSTSAAGMPVGVPGSPFLRVLPLQFAAVGFAAVVAAQWSVQVHARLVTPTEKTKNPAPAQTNTARRGGRR